MAVVEFLTQSYMAIIGLILLETNEILIAISTFETIFEDFGDRRCDYGALDVFLVLNNDFGKVW